MKLLMAGLLLLCCLACLCTVHVKQELDITPHGKPTPTVTPTVTPLAKS